MQLKRYAIIHEASRTSTKKGEKTRWVKFYDDGIGFTLIDKFDETCIMNKDRVDEFLSRPHIDARYKKRIICITVSKSGAVFRP